MCNAKSYLSMCIRTDWNERFVLSHEDGMALLEILSRAELQKVKSGDTPDEISPLDTEDFHVNFMSVQRYQSLKMSQVLDIKLED